MQRNYATDLQATTALLTTLPKGFATSGVDGDWHGPHAANCCPDLKAECKQLKDAKPLAACDRLRKSIRSASSALPFSLSSSPSTGRNRSLGPICQPSKSLNVDRAGPLLQASPARASARHVLKFTVPA